MPARFNFKILNCCQFAKTTTQKLIAIPLLNKLYNFHSYPFIDKESDKVKTQPKKDIIMPILVIKSINITELIINIPVHRGLNEHHWVFLGQLKQYYIINMNIIDCVSNTLGKGHHLIIIKSQLVSQSVEY